MVRGGPVRVGLQAQTGFVEDQVRRIAEAAGALVTTADDADEVSVWVVEDPAGDGASPLPRLPGSPVVRVRAGTGGTPRAFLDRMSPGVDVVLELPADAEALLSCLGALGLHVRARTLALVGARGGAGATTLAAAVAREAARTGACTALVDLDGASGGIDLLLGIEHEAGPRWADLRAERAGFPPDALSMALPRWESVRVLSGDARGGARPGDPGVPDAVRALVSEHDLVVLDLPRNGTWVLAPPAGVAPGCLPCDFVLLVATCDVRSAAAATVAREELGERDVRLVVRTPGPGGLDPVAFADACGLPIVATTRTERGAAAAAERGEAPGDRRRGVVARTATRLVAELALQE